MSLNTTVSFPFALVSPIKLNEAVETVASQLDVEESVLTLALGITEHPHTTEVVGEWSTEQVARVAEMLQDALNDRDAEVKASPVRFSRHISDSDANAIACRMLEACGFYSAAPPFELVQLLVRQLKAQKSTEPQKWLRTNTARAKAAAALAEDPDASMTSIAKAAGVNKSSVSRWMKEKDFLFQAYAMRLDNWFSQGRQRNSEPIQLEPIEDFMRKFGIES